MLSLCYVAARWKGRVVSSLAAKGTDVSRVSHDGIPARRLTPRVSTFRGSCCKGPAIEVDDKSDLLTVP